MKAFGFLSFGHYGHGRGPGDPDARRALHDAVEIAVGADEIGVNGAYWRVHHFARQAASPVPLLAAAGARTGRIEVGTGVIDMRYENPLHLAEEIASLDLLTDRRIAIGISRGSPEQARRGWEAFGYAAGSDERGTDLAHAHTAQLLDAVRGVPQADLDTSNGMAPGASARLRIEPHSPGVDRRLWWGGGIARDGRVDGPSGTEPHELHPADRGHRRGSGRAPGRADPPHGVGRATTGPRA